MWWVWWRRVRSGFSLGGEGERGGGGGGGEGAGEIEEGVEGRRERGVSERIYLFIFGCGCGVGGFFSFFRGR